MSTLVDSNVLIDLLEGPSDRYSWASRQVKEAGDLGPMIVNPIVLAEVAVGFDDVVRLDHYLAGVAMVREPLPWAAAFQAGKAHAIYRRRGGLRERTLPDFLIGAHAQVKGYRLLTRDPRRYRRYFPEVHIIAPDTHP